MRDRVSIDFKDGVADVRLIRADKMNALDPRCSRASSKRVPSSRR